MYFSAVFEPVWIVSLLPQNSTAWEKAVEATDANLVARDPIGLITVARLDGEVPLVWLPYLAEERSVDEFSSAWPESRQRAVTKASFAFHQVKGTRPAIDRALIPLGFMPTLTEWFEVYPRRQANTFRMGIVIDADREWVGGSEEIIRVANGAKNLHTKLEAIEISRDASPAVTFIGGMMKRRRLLRVGYLPRISVLRTPGFLYIGVAQIRTRFLRVGPRP